MKLTTIQSDIVQKMKGGAYIKSEEVKHLTNKGNHCFKTLRFVLFGYNINEQICRQTMLNLIDKDLIIKQGNKYIFKMKWIFFGLSILCLLEGTSHLIEFNKCNNSDHMIVCFVVSIMLMNLFIGFHIIQSLFNKIDNNK